MRIPDFKSGIKRRHVKLIRFLRWCVLTAKKAPVLHCIGDSHMHVMEYVAYKGMLSNTRLEFCIVDGATISGLPNPNSKTQAGPIIQEYLNCIENKDYVLLCLGEVDCGYIIWYRSQKYNESVEKHLSNTLENYRYLILKFKELANNRVIVCSVPPPTIGDDKQWGEVANARSEVKATQLERANLTRMMNKKIEEFCRDFGLIFLDLDSELIDQDTNIVKPCYLNGDPYDHHLDEKAYALIVVNELKKCGLK